MTRLKQITKGQHLSQAHRVYSTDGVACTLQGMSGGVGAKTGLYMISELGNDMRIRKLTPRECFRLQGFPDEYFERAAEVCSDSQLYKQAGNSVTVNVIYEIAKKLE